jgi:hypothetical protein
MLSADNVIDKREAGPNPLVSQIGLSGLGDCHLGRNIDHRVVEFFKTCINVLDRTKNIYFVTFVGNRVRNMPEIRPTYSFREET